MMFCRQSVPLFILFFTLSFQAVAQIPQLINYQGRLVGTNGLINGNVGLSLRLFNVPSGGTSIYEDSNSVTVADGLYSTFIGDNPTNASFLAALTNTDVYIEVAVNGSTLTPRERIAAVAFARVAADVSPDGSGSGLDADLLDGVNSAAFSQTNHNHDAAYVNEGQALSVSAAMMVDGATLSEIADNDGAGSGLDADLLDGINSASFSQTNHNHDATYVNENQTNSVTTQMITDGTVLFVDVAQNGATNGQVMKWNGSAWSAANDSAGSGGATWQYPGNTDAATGTNFLGTINSNTVEIRVDNQTVMRFEPNLYPNIIGGNPSNFINKTAYGAIIAGGGHDTYPNIINKDGNHAAILGGWGDVIGTNAQGSGIGAGYQNTIGDDSDNTFIGGGIQSAIQGGGDGDTIAGGEKNTIAGTTPHWATIGGGSGNVVRAKEGTISGGSGNILGSDALSSFIGGGFGNVITNFNSYDVIAGGYQNAIGVSGAGHDYSAIGGGRFNTISNDYGTIPGGLSNNAVGVLSFAAGNRAKALHQGAFVWGDTSGFDVSSTNNNAWTVRCVGGARFISGINGSGTATAGVILAVNGNSWGILSDRNIKENFREIDKKQVLEKLANLPVTDWNLLTQDSSIRHYGPIAQDFHEAFGLGEDEHYINTSDSDGVTIAALQGLYEVVKEQRAEIDRLRVELDLLKKEGKRELAPPDGR